MSDLREAVALIRKYEGFNEKAFLSDEEGRYTIGYGTQFYPDGSPVKQGQWCTKEKALEYLSCEVKAIKNLLKDLNLHLNEPSEQALISFVHSIGWKPFLYSNVIDCLNDEDWAGVAEEISHWIFDENPGYPQRYCLRRFETIVLHHIKLGPSESLKKKSILTPLQSLQIRLR
jgi:GH24 family phage-related lysozyme (muramidase)